MKNHPWYCTRLRTACTEECARWAPGVLLHEPHDRLLQVDMGILGGIVHYMQTQDA